MERTDRRTFLKNSALGLAGLGLSSVWRNCGKPSKGLPNFVIIFCDDMGYGDMARTGHPTIRTPNLDRMADEGVIMTQFYSAAAVCSPSRAALLTGRYPIRNGIVRVLFPHHAIGLPKDEITLAELLQQKGYATAAIGKWHLGHHPQFLPLNNGFDYYYGIPYSNDMDSPGRNEPPIPLMRNEKIIEQPCDQDTISKRYTEEAIKFMEEHKNSPFFVYLAHTMPHVPLHCSDNFRGKSRRGLYGDVIEEIDWSVGQILESLKRFELDDNTLVIFTSDNGPWTMKNERGGSAGLFRGAKGSTWEGGVREPFIARFPGKLPQGTVCTEVGTTMDIFTTCLKLAGLEIPGDRPIDGKALLPVLKGESKSSHNILYYYWDDRLTAIRAGKYKLHFSKSIGNWKWADCDPYELYDLEVDPSEKYDLAAKKPEIVEKLTRQAGEFKANIARRGENKELIQQLLK